MNKTIPITPFGFRVLSEKKKELAHFVKRSKNQRDYSAMIHRKQLEEVEKLLKSSEVVEFDEKRPASVEIGSKIILEDLRTGDKREYTIMSRVAANPLKGVISNESPLAQKMMGFKLGNTFKIKNIDGSEVSYKILNIE